MQRSTLTIAAVGALILLAVPPAFARGPGGAGGGPPAFAGPPGGGPPTWQGSNPPGFSRGEKAGWGDYSTPPGWRNTKGKKKGWDGQDVPPGLYKRQ